MNMHGILATASYGCQHPINGLLPLHISELQRQVIDLIGCDREKAVEKGTWCRTRVHGAGERPVSAEQMELARLRAELARVKMERDILKKATAYFAKESL
jgi:hypothetical protein